MEVYNDIKGRREYRCDVTGLLYHEDEFVFVYNDGDLHYF